ncbi:unnamed protein product [Peronospora belbahrii]|uniref:Ubiquitin-like domain-containing protein n=1 Tax=Peronospora belbahrii TaxID=622444 RepID=A0AAU9KWY0_9STRA|nr:unnamed protein product [Peronospora belbahrii]CAH0517768.1 unnamed protein product [Peronospora belbahrii]
MDSPALSPSSASTLHDEWALVNDAAEIVASVKSEAKSEMLEHEDEATEVNHEIPQDCLAIRLRQGEKIRPAWFKATQQVDTFVGKFFAEELARGKKIRLIYMGMLLLPSRTMGEYGIEENGVIHSVITDAPAAPHPQAVLQAKLKTLSPQNTLLLLTGVFLYGLWTILYYFPQFFSWKSIVLLSLFSAMHLSAAASRITSSSVFRTLH